MFLKSERLKYMLTSKEKVLAIIIARGGSKSIPRKNVLPLHGKPLIAWPIDLAHSVSRIDRVVVSTDDDEIMNIAKEHGAEVPFKRPAELATDEVPTLPVIQHALAYLARTEDYKPDIVLLLYPTAPFLRKERIDEALDLFENTDCNSVISVVKDWGQFWKKEHDTYTVLHPKERVNRQQFDPLYKEDGAIYFNRYEVLMDSNTIVDDNNVAFIVMEEDENIDIDEPLDFKKAEEKNI